MKTIPWLLITVIFAATPAFADEGKDESGKGKTGRKTEKWSEEQRAGDSYFHKHGYTRLKIPEGQYPPPGECRIWYPDRSPGQQPPPAKCDTSVPAGAWLIQHPADAPRHVHVTVYDSRRPRVIRAVGEFEIGSGGLVRVIVDK